MHRKFSQVFKRKFPNKPVWMRKLNYFKEKVNMKRLSFADFLKKT